MTVDQLFRGHDEQLAFKYARAAALAVPQDVLDIDAGDLDNGLYTDTPYWRTGRVGHATVREQGMLDGLGLEERVVMQGSVRLLLRNRRFIDAMRLTRDQKCDG